MSYGQNYGPAYGQAYGQPYGQNYNQKQGPTLAPLPAPGIAVWPQNIARQQENLILKGQFAGDDAIVYDQNQNVVFRIGGKSLSMSHQQQVCDCHGQLICTIKKDKHPLHPTYWAEETKGGHHLFDCKNDAESPFGNERFTMSCSNNAEARTSAGRGQKILLEFDSPAFQKAGAITYHGRPVAELQASKLQLKDAFSIQVAPGMDRLLAVCMAACIDDRRNTKKKRQIMMTAPLLL